MNRVVGGHDRGAIGGDPSADVRGTHTLTVQGNHHVVVGHKSAESHALLYVNGDYNVGVAGELNLKAMKKLTLAVGDSKIEITPEGITLKGGSVKLEGAAGVSMKVADLEMKMEEKLTLSAKKVEIFSTKGSIVMDDDIHVDAKTVNLNCKPKQPDKSAAEAALPDTGIVSFVLSKKADGTPISGVTALVGTPDGKVIEVPVDATGTVTFTGKKGERYHIIAIKAGDHIMSHEQA